MIYKMSAAAIAAAVIAVSPAQARDGQAYVGIEAGAMFVNDIQASASSPFDFGGIPVVLGGGVGPAAIGPQALGDTGFFDVELDTGYDVGGVVGYDWGLVRTEVELSYRRATFSEVRIDEDDFFGGDHDAKGRISSRSVVVNVLGDLPIGNGFTVSAGPGFGWSSIRANPKVDLFDDGDYTNLQSTRDSGWMLQGIAAVRKELTANLDVGVKYRFVRSERRSYDSDFYGTVEGRLTAHSVLATLTYNIGAPVAR